MEDPLRPERMEADLLPAGGAGVCRPPGPHRHPHGPDVEDDAGAT